MTPGYGGVDIPGLTFERHLGAGAFADVLLFQQEFPRRRVAVKVMREAVTDPRTQASFESEANLLATVSTHPSIVTVYHAAITTTGRPYLVMEYCSRPGLAERIRDRPLSVPEMLQTMIRLSGAVETAHRHGILHRDLKPANVLTTDYGWPALGDFGISVVAGHPTTSGGAMSLPWAAPEIVAGHPFEPVADVYGLAATAYTLLAGASPFELAGAREVPALMSHIMSTPAPRIPRDDVPEAVQQLLAIALAKHPTERPQSASEFARGLQRIEQDMRLPTTHLDIPSAQDLPDDSAERTRLSLRETAVVAGVVTPAPTPAVDDRTVIAEARATIPDPGPNERTVVRPQTPDVAPDEATAIAPPRAPSEPIDDRTAIAPPRNLDIERTALAQPRTPDPDRTALAGRRVDPADQTILRPPAGPAAAEARAWTPPPGARIAYDPGADTAAQTTYGIRESLPTPAITRRAAPAPQVAPTGGSAAARRVRRRRMTWLLIIIGAGALLVLAAAAVAVPLLLGAG
ncbi:protein kinase domain-containing protein [Microbacterium schleiferi]|uniref:non-specific serine/threonine protein kinase n=1 Tax=Microbacterium schleiferi TaxID=69362 RepID=A0ABU7V8F0_9MICO|nr:protein kinase [Micrococcales bacterium]